MILYELIKTENHPVYKQLEVANGARHYDFLRSIVSVALAMKRAFLSTQVLQSLNYHAIACLHTNAGEFRPCDVEVGLYKPPQPHKVRALTDDLVNDVNRSWETLNPVILSAFVLWRLNYIHPFINGNGRTARAACYFVLCLSAGGWLPGKKILPELIRENRPEYNKLLQEATSKFDGGHGVQLDGLHQFLTRLLEEQLDSDATNGNSEPPNDN